MQNIKFHADDYGYSANISQNILDCLKRETIQEMSIMIDSDEKLLQKIQDMNLKNISLHLNLTSLASVGNTDNSKFLKQLTFFKLFFLKNSKKTICMEEISHQIDKYKRFFPDVKLHIDGHHHIQIIPWIFTFLLNNKDFKISSIRIPNEKIVFLSFSYLINLTFYRNLFAVLILKALTVNLKKFSKRNFAGLLYSGIYTENNLNKHIAKLKSKKAVTELTFHPGTGLESEKETFKDNHFKYVTSKNRLREFHLLMSRSK